MVAVCLTCASILHFAFVTNEKPQCFNLLVRRTRNDRKRKTRNQSICRKMRFRTISLRFYQSKRPSAPTSMPHRSKIVSRMYGKTHCGYYPPYCRALPAVLVCLGLMKGGWCFQPIAHGFFNEQFAAPFTTQTIEACSAPKSSKR
jgi:hypothetical protein